MVIRARSNELEGYVSGEGEQGASRITYVRSPSGVQIVDGRYVDAMIADVGHFSYEFCRQGLLDGNVPGFGIWLAEIQAYRRVVLIQKARCTDLAGYRNDSVRGNGRHEGSRKSAFPDACGCGFGQAQISGGPVLSMASGFPAPLVATIPANGIIPVTGKVGTTSLLNQNYTAVSLNFREPYTESWNIAVEQSLPAKFVGEVAYVGNHGVDIPTVYNLNAARAPNVGNAGRPLFPLTGNVALKFIGTSSN